MSNQNPPGFTEHHLHVIGRGLELFNDKMYWECHEELEHHWIEDTSDPVRNVYWAIIQIAAALIHVRENNIVGARGLLIKARDKIMRCEKLGIETKYLFESINWQEFKDEIEAIQNLDDLNAYRNLYDFNFVIHGNSK